MGTFENKQGASNSFAPSRLPDGSLGLAAAHDRANSFTSFYPRSIDYSDPRIELPLFHLPA